MFLSRSIFFFLICIPTPYAFQVSPIEIGKPLVSFVNHSE